MATRPHYDEIGHGYPTQRRPDPRIAREIERALGDARSVVNVGAGAGSYEPMSGRVVAVEPSSVMVAQRASGTAPAVRASAEALPFGDASFDAALAILTVHHWHDRHLGLRECRRVARRRIVVFTWDPSSPGFWLVQEYFPQFLALDRQQFPGIGEFQNAFGADARIRVTPVAVPKDCVDGFLGAYWARPEAYLAADVRRGISSFARPDATAGLNRLRADLASGAWHRLHGDLLERDTLDVGYRVVVAEC